MAKTIEQILANHVAHAARSETGMATAIENGDYRLAALNCRQRLKSWLMQGLIVWRLGDNPTRYFEHAAMRFAEDWQALKKIGDEAAKLSDAGHEQVYFVSYLIGYSLPFAVQPNADATLQCDRMLDAVLGRWLFNGWDGSLWEAGMVDLQREGSDLSVETYELYKEVTQATDQELRQLEVKADKLFRRRKKDSFFAGGVQTSGGGPSNDITVDYRFAALAKHAGHVGDGIHAWRW